MVKTLGDGPQRAGALFWCGEPHRAASHSQFALGEPLRDLGYRPQVDLAGMVQRVLGAHEEQNLKTARAFKSIDADGSGKLTRSAIESHVRKYLVRGREDYSETGQQQVEGFIDRLMEQLDASGDGEVSWENFSEWNRNNSIETEIWKQVATVEDELAKNVLKGYRPATA